MTTTAIISKIKKITTHKIRSRFWALTDSGPDNWVNSSIFGKKKKKKGGNEKGKIVKRGENAEKDETCDKGRKMGEKKKGWKRKRKKRKWKKGKGEEEGRENEMKYGEKMELGKDKNGEQRKKWESNGKT